MRYVTDPMRTIRITTVATIALASCRSLAPTATAPRLGIMPFPVDSITTQAVTAGVTRRVVRSAHGPWTINVLYARLDRCNTGEAVKGADTATGQYKTTALLNELASHENVVGGVNGDFFNLKNGSPTNLLVVNGRMLSPPNDQPVLAFDSTGTPRIVHFTMHGARLTPFYPINAIGGRGVLVRDSSVYADVDTSGSAGFRGRNPRTAAGIARARHELLLVTVDGRTVNDAGMTLRELAGLMLALGAHDAINLDGGGSTTFVYADPDSNGRLRIGNHPSDSGGERTVGDALAVVHKCTR